MLPFQLASVLKDRPLAPLIGAPAVIKLGRNRIGVQGAVGGQVSVVGWVTVPSRQRRQGGGDRRSRIFAAGGAGGGDGGTLVGYDTSMVMARVVRHPPC